MVESSRIHRMPCWEYQGYSMPCILLSQVVLFTACPVSFLITRFCGSHLNAQPGAWIELRTSILSQVFLHGLGVAGKCSSIPGAFDLALQMFMTMPIRLEHSHGAQE